MVEYLGFSSEVLFLLAGDIVLLLMSGMMSSSEVAYFSLSPAELRRIKRGGSVATESASKLLDDPDIQEAFSTCFPEEDEDWED